MSTRHAPVCTQAPLPYGPPASTCVAVGHTHCARSLTPATYLWALPAGSCQSPGAASPVLRRPHLTPDYTPVSQLQRRHSPRTPPHRFVSVAPAVHTHRIQCRSCVTGIDAHLTRSHRHQHPLAHRYHGNRGGRQWLHRNAHSSATIRPSAHASAHAHTQPPRLNGRLRETHMRSSVLSLPCLLQPRPARCDVSKRRCPRKPMHACRSMQSRTAA